MRLSVIIPALHEEATIGAAIESAWQAGAAEVIVADGGSQDGTCRASIQAGACVVSSPAGRGIQQRLGAESATGDILLFLHADSRLSPAVGEQLSELYFTGAACWGCFRQSIEAKGLKYRLLELGNRQRTWWSGLAYGDQAIFVTHDLYKKCGRFEPLPLMEDVVLSRSLMRYQRPTILRGPVQISARRWSKNGVVRQTLTNWGILCRYYLGVKPEELAKLYRRHDK